MTPYDALAEHFCAHDVELALRVLDAAGYVIEPRPRAGEEEIREVWQAYLTHHQRAHLDTRRRRLISTRLRDGFTVDQLTAAIHGNHRSPWHCGDNPDGKSYHDLGLILRNADTIERFAAAAGGPADVLAKRNLSARDLAGLADTAEGGGFGGLSAGATRDREAPRLLPAG